MQIGGVAKKVGLTPDAIRFYERNALLPRAPRTPGGFRQYADTDLETLGFIRQAQGLGFTLKEVRELLELRHRRLQPCAPVRLRLSQKLLDVHKKLTDLQKLERELRGPARVRQETWQSVQTLSATFWQEFPEIEKRKLKVEVLYVLDCPFHAAAVKLVKEVLATEVVAAEIDEVLVADGEMAREFGFLGSPTIRINGRDVTGESRNDQNVGLACRLYEGSRQLGLPPADLVRQAVRQARQGEKP